MAIFSGSKKGHKEAKAVSANAGMKVRPLSAGKAHDVLLAPWFSEKALLSTDKGIYTFGIPKSATKATVAAAIHEVYKVTPMKVRIVNLPGRRVSMRSRGGHAVRAARRKAYVYLKKGDTIQFA